MYVAIGVAQARRATRTACYVRASATESNRATANTLPPSLAVKSQLRCIARKSGHTAYARHAVCIAQACIFRSCVTGNGQLAKQITPMETLMTP